MTLKLNPADHPPGTSFIFRSSVKRELKRARLVADIRTVNGEGLSKDRVEAIRARGPVQRRATVGYWANETVVRYDTGRGTWSFVDFSDPGVEVVEIIPPEQGTKTDD